MVGASADTGSVLYRMMEESTEGGESAEKEVKWHYKDISIRLWKTIVTKSETQWSEMEAMRFIKAFAQNNQSPLFSSSFLI